MHVPGREILIESLVSWAVDTSTPLAVKTITGSGGAGKTRLAAEVCLSVAGQGWDAGFADFVTPGGGARTSLERPTFIVVDDADLNYRSAGSLVRSTIYSPTPVRLLLLSRNRAGWWTAFNTESENNATGFDHGDVSLDDHILSVEQRHELYERAHHCFRQLLAADPAAAPSLDLSTAQFASPLLVQLTALVTALGGGATPSGTTTIGDPRAGLLRAAVARETDRWVKNLVSETQVVANDRVIRRCVTTATLTSPPAHELDAHELEQAAVALLRAVPELAQAEDGRLITLSSWLHGLHRGPDYWNPLRPDPLCDQLLADLDILPHLSATLTDIALRLGDAYSLSRLLSELTRAAAASGGAAQLALQRLLAPTHTASEDAAS